MGWRHRDADRTTSLQDSLWYAVREDRPPERVWDFQTADLSTQSGWGRWGPSKPGGGSSEGTHVLRKEYLADASFTVALGLHQASGEPPVDVDDLEAALRSPARPLALGRKACPPSDRILQNRISAKSPVLALALVPVSSQVSAEGGPVALRIWMDEADLPDGVRGQAREVWDRRNYRSSRFDMVRRIVVTRQDFGREE
jgi:CRISPR system Cascade subunit CasD